jgi:hypothetical protein
VARITSTEEAMTPDREERIQKEREERIREERIRLRALEIWKEQGCPDGRAREHWEQAEREVGGHDGSEAGSDQPTVKPPRLGRLALGPRILITPDGSCGKCQVVGTVRRIPENTNDLVKWLRLARRLLIVDRLPLDLEDHLFDVLGNLIVHVRHRASSQGRIRL